MTYEAIRLNTTGVSKEVNSKVNLSDLQNLGVSKEITLADTQSISSNNNKEELILIDHQKPRSLLHQRAYSQKCFSLPP